MHDVVLIYGLFYNRSPQELDLSCKFWATTTRTGRWHYKGHAKDETLVISEPYRRPLFKSGKSPESGIVFFTRCAVHLQPR